MKQEMKLEVAKPTIRRGRSWYLVVLMALSFGVGELSHFLVGTTTMLMARDLHYGDQSCFPNTNVSAEIAANVTCPSYKNETE